jgi:hypothetical protein
MVTIIELHASSIEESESVLDTQGGIAGLEKILDTNLSSGLSGDVADITQRKEDYGTNNFPVKEMDSVSRTLFTFFNFIFSDTWRHFLMARQIQYFSSHG